MTDIIGGSRFLLPAVRIHRFRFCGHACPCGADVHVVDALTYAGNRANLDGVVAPDVFTVADIADRAAMDALIAGFDPHYVVNFAAESHVDRSVDDPLLLYQQISPNTDASGSVAPGNAERGCTAEIRADKHRRGLWRPGGGLGRAACGAACCGLGREALLYGPDAFSEVSPLRPSSPYSASKASADLMAVAYQRSFGLPVGGYALQQQLWPAAVPRELIPLMINNMLGHRTFAGIWQRHQCARLDSLDDHCRGVLAAAVDGLPERSITSAATARCAKSTLCVGSSPLCATLTGDPRVSEDLIRFVGDRPATTAVMPSTPIVNCPSGMAPADRLRRSYLRLP